MAGILALPPWIPVVVIGGVCGAAIIKGGPEERIAGVAFALGTIATPFIRDRSWGTQWAIFGVDVAYLALLVVIALRSRRYWPIWAAGFQLLGVLTHAAKILDPTLRPWAYVTGGVIFTYLGLWSIAFGTWGAWRERQFAKAGLATGPGATRL